MSETTKQLSISFRSDDGCIEHNNRIFFAKNVDQNRTLDNITYVKRDLRELYHELFDEALAEYNARQTRADRRINDYYEHIRQGKKEKLFQEIIVMFGNSNDCGVGTENWKLAKQLLDEYMREFEKRNPNLKVFNAVMHLDEATPHLHIDFVPVCYDQKQGLKTRVSMKRAIQQMGFSANGKKETEAILWGNSERKKLTEILNGHNISRQIVGAFHDHKVLDEYKKMMSVLHDTNEHITTLKKKNPVDLTEVDVGEILNQNEWLRDYVSKQQSELSKYRAWSAAKILPVEVYNDEKRQYILEQLQKVNCPFIEENNAIYVPEYYEPSVKKAADAFKPMNSNSVKDRLKFFIDRLIISANNFEDFLEQLKRQENQVKQGKFISVKPPYSKRFIRLKSLGEGYSEFEIKQRIEKSKAIVNEFKKLEESYADDLQKPFYRAINVNITLVSSFQITPRKKYADQAYSILNDRTIENLNSCLNTLSDFGINSQQQLYRLSEELQKKIENSNGDEREELQDQYARISDVIRVYEEIVEGNYIDNLIRAEKERQEAIQRAEQKNAADQHKTAQTVNRKRHR